MNFYILINFFFLINLIKKIVFYYSKSRLAGDDQMGPMIILFYFFETGPMIIWSQNLNDFYFVNRNAWLNKMCVGRIAWRPHIAIGLSPSSSQWIWSWHGVCVLARLIISRHVAASAVIHQTRFDTSTLFVPAGFVCWLFRSSRIKPKSFWSAFRDSIMTVN